MSSSLAFPVSLDYKRLFETLPGLYLILNPGLIISAASDAYLAATMTRRDQIVGQHIFSVFPDNPADPAADGVRNLNASLQYVLTHRQANFMPVQKYDIRREADGSFEERFWLPCNVPLLGNDGSLEYIIHAAQDITGEHHANRARESEQRVYEAHQEQNLRAEKEANARLAVSENRLKNLVNIVLDTIIDGVITINLSGEIQSYNKTCISLFGYTPEEVIGRNVKMLMPEPYRSEHDGYIRNYQKTANAKVIGIGRAVSGRRKDGTLFPMELAVGKTEEDSEHAYVGIIRDITERIEADKAREQLRQAQKMEALGQLTGGIAHDFNNLLAVILGNLDFLAEKFAKEAPEQKFIQPSISAAEHGAELTRQLLAFGRKQALQPQPLAVKDLLEPFVPFLRHTLGERIRIILQPSPDVWNVCVDPTHLQNALLNLSVNARDAMPEGGKLIFETRNIVFDGTYTTQNLDVEPGEYVAISVTDTGQGMSPQVLEKAFEPFFTTKEVGKGTGLGLSMVYGFVKQSSGHIKLYSEQGSGTTITIYLPRSYDLPPETEKINPAPMPVGSAVVLVVEDNKEVLRLTSAMVASLGYLVLTAETGDDALEIVKARPDISLLMTDVMLAGSLNGPDLAEQALIIHPGLKVLFNSGYAEHAIFQGGLLEEGAQLLSKPFRKYELAEKLAHLLPTARP